MSIATKSPCATTFTFNHVAKTIDGKECDFKRASIPGSEFEALLLSRMAAQPTYTLNPIKINTNPNKKSYAGLNRKLMLDYIATQVDAELRMAEYNKFVEEGEKFPVIKSWFLDTYKGFNVAKAQKAILNHTKATIKAKAKIVKVSSSEDRSKKNAESSKVVNF